MIQRIPPMSALAWPLAAGTTLKVTDIEGGQSGDVFAVAADDVSDGLSNGHTFDYGGTIRLSAGSVLYSRRSRPLLKIVEDEVGAHDFLYAPCSQEMFELSYGATEPHPNCRDNLTAALAEFGMPPAALTIAFNVFMNVTISPDGRLDIQPPTSITGQSITFAAERDIFIAVSACSASGASGGQTLSLQVETP